MPAGPCRQNTGIERAMSAEAPILNVGATPKIIPVVLPPSADLGTSGRIRNVAVRVVDHSGWLQDDDEGGWVLKPAMTRKGYVLLEDLYRSEGNEAGWAQYQRYISDWQKGRTTRAFPAHLLPLEVTKRQRGDVPSEFADPWNLPVPAATTGAVSEAKPSKGK